MPFYVEPRMKFGADESKRLIRLTPAVKTAMTKVSKDKYVSNTTHIEWGVVDVDGVPHLARLENEENKEKVAAFMQRTKVAIDIQEGKNKMSENKSFTKLAMDSIHSLGGGEPGPVEHSMEFEELGENDPTVDMLSMAEGFETPEGLISEIALKYNMSDDEAIALYEDIKQYVTKFSSLFNTKIVTAWSRFITIRV